MADILKLFLTASVMASIMICIVLLIRRVFSKKMSPAAMLLLWGLVLFRLVLPVTISSPVQLSGLFPQQTLSSGTDIATVPPEGSMPGANTVSDNGPHLPDTDTDSPPGRETMQPPAEAAPAGAALGDMLKDIPWWNVLAAAWAAGVAATLLFYVWKAVRFKRKLKFCDPVADKNILDFIQIHKKETGVKKAVAVMECDFVRAPAVFGYFKPMILIPSRYIKEMGRDSLNAILLHEIYHIRCHDILKNYIWLAAKALHWFNPLVWLAYKSFEDDVELRRDQKAAHILEADGAFIYSRSLLEAARFSKQAVYMPSAAAALFENKCKLRQRVLRLVKPQRKTKSAAVVSTLLAMIMVFGCFTTACRPTPEAPPVANKNTGIVAAVLAASGDKEELKKQKQAIQGQIEALGGHLETSFNPSEQITINVDADIVTHGLDPIPLVRVEPENFTKEKFETFMDLLTDGQPVYYEYTETDKHGNEVSFPLTKEEITAILLNVKGYLLNDDLPDDIRSDWDLMIKLMEQEYENTISRADEKLYNGTLNEMKGYNAFTVLKCYMGKDMAANLGLQQSLDGGATHMIFNNHNFGSGYNMFETYEGVDAERLDITYEKAKAIAEDFVRTLDGEDSSMMLYKSAIGYEIETLPNYTRDTSPQAYAFYFARSYNEIPVTRVMFLRGGSETVNYSERVLAEYISVEIDDEGIKTAEWLDYKKYIETVSEDTPLLDFDTIRQIFEQHCAQEFGWNPGYEDESIPSDIGVTFNVKKIEMNLMSIPEKDNPGIYITVPVWDFIADESYDEEFLSVEGYPYEGQKDVSIVTVNAIDGSIINREYGY